MTVNFETLYGSEELLKRLVGDEDEIFISYVAKHKDSNKNKILVGSKINAYGTEIEKGIFWNGRLIVHASLIPNANQLNLAAIHCFTDHSGVQREGEFRATKLFRGTLILPSGATYIGQFDTQERLIEGELIQKDTPIPHTLKGTFSYGKIRNVQITRCEGTKIYSTSKYQETGVFDNGDKVPFEPFNEGEQRVDEQGVVRLGRFEGDRLVRGRITYRDYRLEGIFSYGRKSGNLICEGIMTTFKSPSRSVGVFVNGVLIKGVRFQNNEEKRFKNFLPLSEYVSEPETEPEEADVPFILRLDEDVQ